MCRQRSGVYLRIYNCFGVVIAVCQCAAYRVVGGVGRSQHVLTWIVDRVAGVCKPQTRLNSRAFAVFCWRRACAFVLAPNNTLGRKRFALPILSWRRCHPFPLLSLCEDCIGAGVAFLQFGACRVCKRRPCCNLILCGSNAYQVLRAGIVNFVISRILFPFGCTAGLVVGARRVPRSYLVVERARCAWLAQTLLNFGWVPHISNAAVWQRIVAIAYLCAVSLTTVVLAIRARFARGFANPLPGSADNVVARQIPGTNRRLFFAKRTCLAISCRGPGRVNAFRIYLARTECSAVLVGMG